MDNKYNKLLSRQILRHFGDSNSIPDNLKVFIETINETYNNFYEDIELLQNSIEINSIELMEFNEKQQENLKFQKRIYEKIHDVILKLNQSQNIDESHNHTYNSDELINILLTHIQEKQETEESLQKLSQAVEQSPAIVVITDLNGVIEYINPKFTEVTGYTYQEAIGQNPRLLKSDIQPSEFYAHLWNTIKLGNVWRGEFLNKKKNGELVWEIATISPIFNNSGEMTHFIAIKEDITKQKKAEESLNEITELQNILMKISNTFINVSLEKTDNIINQSLADLGRYTKTDRTYIFTYDLINNTCSNTYEWCSDGTTPQIDELQDIPNDAIPEWVNAHFMGKSIKIPNTYDLDQTDPIRKILEPQGIKSILALPMMDDDVCIGFVGFDAVKDYHIFSEKEQRLLELFALMLVNLQKRNKTQSELKMAMEQAKVASKAKTEFLANMSHEIRTPLNGVIGFTDLLLNTPLSPIQQQYVNNANVSGHTLLGIINDILDFSKIEAGMLNLELIKTDIIELIENSVDIVKYTAGKKNIELLLNIDSKLPQCAVVDQIRLKQILANLLSNAVKFTEVGEVEFKVTFEALPDGKGKIGFYIHDTGIGISETQKNNLFKAFTQADSSTTRKYGGTGLGLTISEMIVRKMNSNIHVESTIGKGSTFGFEIITDVEDRSETDINLFEKIKRCLIIDDNANNRLILEHMLSIWNIHCESSDNGLSALQRIETSSHFDVIICDYNMPYFDGIETIRMIRKKMNLNNKKQPIILLHSSSEEADLHDKCEDLDVKYLLTKPVKSKDLYAYLRSVCDGTHPSNDSNNNHLNQTQVETTSNHSFSILIAEDVPMNMMMIKALLEKIQPNAQLTEAATGLEAIQLYKKINPDLIFMDIQMPDMDGLDATREIRRIEQNTNVHIPIIALTAGAFNEEKERCIGAGMDDFLTKPIQVDKIQTVFNNYLINKDEVESHFSKSDLLEHIGSDDIVDQLIELALVDFPKLINDIDSSLQNSEISNMKKTAHQLKGVALNMSCNTLADIAAKIELHIMEDSNTDTTFLQNQTKELQQEWINVKKLMGNKN